MSKKFYILSFVLCLAACSSTQFTVDDAYHWEDRSAVATTTATPSSSSGQYSSTSSTSQSSSSSSTGPTLEYINVQDTTITVRIKR